MTKTIDFQVTSATIETENIEDDNPQVDRVVLETGHEMERVTAKPRVDAEKERKAMDLELQQQDQVPPTVREFRSEFETLAAIIETVQEGENVVIEALVDDYTPDDRNETYYYVRSGNIQDIKQVAGD